jgi:hypothetical protein
MESPGRSLLFKNRVLFVNSQLQEFLARYKNISINPAKRTRFGARSLVPLTYMRITLPNRFTFEVVYRLFVSVKYETFETK